MRVSHPFRFKNKIGLTYYLLVLFFVSALFSAAVFPETDTLQDTASDQEKRIKDGLDLEFGRIGPKAYIMKGTLLYLYYPRRSKYLNINSLGFRGDRVKPKAKRAFHIAVLGGSTVFGVRQADFQTIPHFLQDILRKKFTKRKVNVYNLGIEGYTIQREAALAERLAGSVKPDLVIFYHGWNDMSMAYHINYGDISPFDEEDETFFAKRQLEAPVQHAITGAAGRVWNRMSGRKWWASPPGSNLDERKALFLRGYLKTLRAALEVFQQKSIPVLFVIQPSLATRKNKTLREQGLSDSIDRRYPGNMGFVSQCVAELRKSDAFREGVLLDVSDAFDGYDGEIYRDDVHVNEMGNKIAAERLAGIVQSGGYIQSDARAR